MCREAPTSPLSSAAEAGTCVGKLLFLPLSSAAGAGTGDVNFNNTPTVGLSGIISQNGMSTAAARAVLARDFGLGGPRGRDQEMFNKSFFVFSVPADDLFTASPGVCAILLRLYTSTERLKRLYTSPGSLLKICYLR